MKKFFLPLISLTFLVLPCLFAFSEFDTEPQITLPQGAPQGVVLRENSGKAEIFFVDEKIVKNDEDAERLAIKLENLKPESSVAVETLQKVDSYAFSEFGSEDTQEAWWFYRYSNRYDRHHYYSYHGRRACDARSWYCGSYNYRFYRTNYVSYNYAYTYYRPSWGFRYYFYWF